MQCLITSAKETITLSNLKSVQIPTVRGTATIERGHAEYFTQIKEGTLHYTNETNTKKELSIAQGVCHVLHNQILIVL